MPQHLKLLAALLTLIVASLPSTAAPTTTAPADPVELHAARAETADISASGGLVPLPKTCGGGLPPTESVPVCCMFGYVFADGLPVARAQVTIANARGTVVEWTGAAPDSPEPYFRTSLSDAPLRAQAGETVTITVAYSGLERTITHQVLPGGQQVDVVLPRTSPDDYIFDRQLWQLGRAGEFNAPSEAAIDATGTVYVLDRDNARVQVFTAQGVFMRQWGDQGGEEGMLAQPDGIAVDRRGYVYVADTVNNRIQKYTNTGTLVRSWGTAGPGSGQFKLPTGIAVADNGDIYVADTWNNRVQRLNKDGVPIGSWGSSGSGNGQFVGPRGIALDRDGNVYVADTDNNRVQKFSATGAFLGKWGGKGNAPGQFEFPYRLDVDAAGQVYVTDGKNHRIQVFDGAGNLLRTWGTFGVSPGQLRYPYGIAIAESGDVYVADSGNSRIQVFSASGQLLRRWGSQSNAGGKLARPRRLAIDQSGRLLVADWGNDRILRYDDSLALQGAIGGPDAPVDLFSLPSAAAVDPQGNLYVADTGNHRIRKLDPAGQGLATWGGNEAGSNPGQFREPGDVALDAAGNLYVADTSNSRVQKLSPSGQVLAVWGAQGSGQGQLDRPSGIAVDSQGNVYVADTWNDRVQKFTGDGAYLGQWGGKGSGAGQLWRPSDVAVAPAVGGGEAVYVVEYLNHRVQMFDTAGQPRRIWGELGSGPGQLYTPEGFARLPDGRLAISDNGNNRVQVLRPMTFTRPIATIVAVGQPSVVQGQPLQVWGMGGDSDETPEVAAYEWRIDGGPAPVATSASAALPTDALAPGRHTLTFSVRDAEGETSAPQAITFDVAPASQQQAERWTFLLYLDGDAPNLAPFLNRTSALGALYRLEHTAPNPNVTVVALYDGPAPGGGDSYRYILRPDGTMSQDYAQEVNMGDPQTLSDFVSWGQAQASADHYYLAIADHANALDGIAWDQTSDRHERLTPSEIRQALIASTGGGARPIDVLHFDGCLMGLLESAYQVRGLARYLVASENIGWSSFAYDRYRAAVGPKTSPRELAGAVSDRYAAIVGAGGYPYTVSALDLSQIDAAARATDALAGELLRYALAGAPHRDELAALRGQAQKLDSSANYMLADDDEYVDLDHWAQLVSEEVGDGAVRSAGGALRAALAALVISNHAASGELGQVTGISSSGYTLTNARGVAIYYPPRASVRTYQVYARGELTFSEDSLWDEYLAAGLASLPFDQSAPQPNPAEPLNLQCAYCVYLPGVRR